MCGNPLTSLRIPPSYTQLAISHGLYKLNTACLTFFLFVKKKILNSNPDVSLTYTEVKRSGIFFFFFFLVRLKSEWWKLRTPFSLINWKTEYERGSTEKENKGRLLFQSVLKYATFLHPTLEVPIYSSQAVRSNTLTAV